jgi:hypothetical protein
MKFSKNTLKIKEFLLFFLRPKDIKNVGEMGEKIKKLVPTLTTLPYEVRGCKYPNTQVPKFCRMIHKNGS